VVEFESEVSFVGTVVNFSLDLWRCARNYRVLSPALRFASSPFSYCFLARLNENRGVYCSVKLTNPRGTHRAGALAHRNNTREFVIRAHAAQYNRRDMESYIRGRRIKVLRLRERISATKRRGGGTIGKRARYAEILFDFRESILRRRWLRSVRATGTRRVSRIISTSPANRITPHPPPSPVNNYRNMAPAAFV